MVYSHCSVALKLQRFFFVCLAGMIKSSFCAGDCFHFKVKGLERLTFQPLQTSPFSSDLGLSA